MKHPMQPIVIDKNGIPRFKENKLVTWLLENGGNDMNDLARQRFSKADRRQFAQLIGYSTSGYGDLSYAQDHKSVDIADELASSKIADCRPLADRGAS